jgi:biopolymer transport protein TolR
VTTDSKRKRLRAIRAVRHQEDERVPGEVKADINVTPLVDVVLVLLIIFMVVTPMIAAGVAVDLPRTAHHAKKPDDGKDIIVSVTQDARMFIGSNRVNRAEDVGRAVSAEMRKFPGKSIFLKGDARAPFGAVRKVMDSLHEQEIEDVTLGTEERTDVK